MNSGTELLGLTQRLHQGLVESTGPKPFAGLWDESAFGSVTRVLLETMVDVCRQILATQQRNELSATTSLLAQMGIPALAGNPFARSLFAQIELIRAQLIADIATHPESASVIEHTVARAKNHVERRTYELVFGGRRVGRVVFVREISRSRHPVPLHRFEGNAAIFLQQLARLREYTPGECIYFADVLRHLGRAADGTGNIRKQAHDAVRAAIYRKLPKRVGKALLKSRRGEGYQLSEAVQITGEVDANWSAQPARRRPFVGGEPPARDDVLGEVKKRDRKSVV